MHALYLDHDSVIQKMRLACPDFNPYWCMGTQEASTDVAV